MATLTDSDFLAQNLRNVFPAFRFTLEVDDTYTGIFFECTLPNVEWEVEEIKEGGVNNYIHQLPGQQKSSSRIILKTGVMIGPLSALSSWYLDSMKSTIVHKKVTVKLLDANAREIITWEILDAFPVKWTAPQLKTDSNTIAINTLELACGLITVK